MSRAESHEHPGDPRVEEIEQDAQEFAYTSGAIARVEAQRADRPAEGVPDSLRNRLDADARRFVESALPRRLVPTAARAAAENEGRSSRSSSSAWAFGGGMLLAACLGLLVASAWLATVSFDPQSEPGLVDARADPPPIDWSDSQTVELAGVSSGYSGVSGTLRWDATHQRGLMRFVGLPPNDPAAGQYQLWIVDPTRGPYPVDGGVFDVSADAQIDGSVEVAFEPRLPIAEPTLFAVTFEQPGGVVVSDGPLLVVGEAG